jgi:hypothetical protein
MLKTVFILLLLNISLMAQTNSFDKLYELYNTKQYFKFISQCKEQENSLDANQKNVCKVFSYALQNNPSESEKYFNEILAANAGLHDSVKKDLYSVSIINNVWLGNYEKSAERSKIVLDKYSAYIKKEDKEEYENSLIIWNAMKGVGRQEVVRSSDTKINMKRDLAGLYNIPVTYNNETHDFIFDTGANFSKIK